MRGRRLVAHEGRVGADHADRVADEVAQRLAPRARCHLVDTQVLGQQEVAQHVDRVVAALVDHLAERAALPAQQVRRA